MAQRRIPTLLTLLMFCGLESASTLAHDLSGEIFMAAGRSSVMDLEKQAVAVDKDPFGVASYLEDFRAGKALRQYASSMLADGQAERLGKQWAALVADRDALARSEQKDGSLWWPQAEDVGFFTGGAGRPEPKAGQEIEEWLTEAVASLSRPARSTFDRAYRVGASR